VSMVSEPQSSIPSSSVRSASSRVEFASRRILDIGQEFQQWPNIPLAPPISKFSSVGIRRRFATGSNSSRRTGRAVGFTVEPVVAADRKLPPIVGLARTGMIRAKEAPRGPIPSREDWYDYVAAKDMPTIAMLQDIDDLPGYGAFWGEVHPTADLALGVTSCVTNGSFRDVDTLAPGFQIIGGCIGPSHAYVHMVQMRCDVNVLGMLAADDDIIHADLHRASSFSPMRCASGPMRSTSSRVVARNGVGFDAVDIQALNRHGILLTNTPLAVRHSVATIALALILALSLRVPLKSRLTKKVRWSERGDFPGVGPPGSTLGVVGLGGIGRELIRLIQPFAMRVIGADPFVTHDQLSSISVELLPLDEVLAQSDFVVIACLLNGSTRHLINASRTALMKPTAFFVNVARGPIIEEAALIAALKSGALAGAGLDVFEHEPPDRPLLDGKRHRDAPFPMLDGHLRCRGRPHRDQEHHRRARGTPPRTYRQANGVNHPRVALWLTSSSHGLNDQEAGLCHRVQDHKGRCHVAPGLRYSRQGGVRRNTHGASRCGSSMR
jgi:phosphoglycerate dehydrogenase-like enzyme